jgi:hypothetical protein
MRDRESASWAHMHEERICPARVLFLILAVWGSRLRVLLPGLLDLGSSRETAATPLCEGYGSHHKPSLAPFVPNQPGRGQKILAREGQVGPWFQPSIVVFIAVALFIFSQIVNYIISLSSFLKGIIDSRGWSVKYLRRAVCGECGRQ